MFFVVISFLVEFLVSEPGQDVLSLFKQGTIKKKSVIFFIRITSDIFKHSDKFCENIWY